ncbi:MAG: HAMP domain-containing histidine kinase [Armatimonadetes bacterium]|nr:HAMP domain-containing histidine kinase [Armatimonadota bacterium]
MTKLSTNTVSPNGSSLASPSTNGTKLSSPMERFNPNRLSIKWKVFVPVAGIVLAAFLGYAYLGLHAAETQLLEKTGRSASVLATMIERAIRPSANLEDDAMLRRLLADLEGLPDLEGLRVLHPDGRFRAGLPPHLDMERIETLAPMLERAMESPTGTSGRVSDAWTYHVVRVIRRSDRTPTDEPIGFLEIHLSMEDTRDRIVAGRIQLSYITVLTLLVLAGALMVIIHVLISSPLAVLTRAMSRVESGDLSTRAQIRSGDELEQLGHSFNRMVEEIETKNTQLLEAGEQLMRQEKLASIGLLAAGVAHEINNPVATISMSAEGLIESEESPERRKFLRAIIEESERIGAIVRNLLGFEKGGYAAYEPCSLTAILREAEEDLRREAERANVTVTMDLRMTGDRVLGQEDQLRQAFVNIMDNALRAMEMNHGGRLDLLAETEGETARIHFRDTGPGIAKEHQPHLFDPFFTTREVGEGFGLGLAVCYEIIKRHGGDITVVSDSGGTIFTIELPLLRPAEENDLTDATGAMEEEAGGEAPARVVH